MKFQTKNSSLLLLLLPSIATALIAEGALDPRDKAGAAIESRDQADNDITAGLKGRHSVPTKDAPVDGADGKPHSGPFVETDGIVGSGKEELSPLKGRPDDPTVIDGKKIPKSNDGVMFDKNRERPQEGTTGTEGGVSEKTQQRKAQEGKTGERALVQPEAPKEKPPTPEGGEEKLQVATAKDDDSGFTGLDKPDDLPDKPYDSSPPIPDSAKKDHLDITKPVLTGSESTSHDSEDVGVIQPFHSFVLSLTMILVSEVGDKTFLVAALMAMKHDRMVVFSAAFGALLVMTVLSAVLGHAVPALIPKKITSFLAAGLFFVFGAKLLREGMEMDPNEGVTAEMHEVEQELAEKEKELGRHQRNGNGVSPYALEMGLEGRHSRSKSRISTPPRSPSESPQRHSPDGSSLTNMIQGAGNLCSLLLSPAWVQTFIMTFLGEWGDRSQIATIAMAAGQDYWWVTLGAMVGHCICTGVAVIGGRAIAGRVSLKVVTVGGAVAFLVFGFIYLIEALYA